MAPQSLDVTGTTTTKRRRRARRKLAGTTTAVRSGAGTGIGTASSGFGPMHKAAGHDLANIVYGFALGRSISPKQAVGYLNTVAENW